MSLSYLPLLHLPPHLFVFFFFNDTATTEIYTLSLHDALPISDEPPTSSPSSRAMRRATRNESRSETRTQSSTTRSEEHTSELQSRLHLVCRLLLEKKKKTTNYNKSHKRKLH